MTTQAKGGVGRSKCELLGAYSQPSVACSSLSQLPKRRVTKRFKRASPHRAMDGWKERRRQATSAGGPFEASYADVPILSLPRAQAVRAHCECMGKRPSGSSSSERRRRGVDRSLPCLLLPPLSFLFSFSRCAPCPPHPPALPSSYSYCSSSLLPPRIRHCGARSLATPAAGESRPLSSASPLLLQHSIESEAKQRIHRQSCSSTRWQTQRGTGIACCQ